HRATWLFEVFQRWIRNRSNKPGHRRAALAVAADSSQTSVAARAPLPICRAAKGPVEDDPSAPTFRASGRLCRLGQARHAKQRNRGRAAGSLGGFAVWENGVTTKGSPQRGHRKLKPRYSRISDTRSAIQSRAVARRGLSADL